MKIGEVAAYTGLSSKTIRYYESIGIISPAKRHHNGYRDYSEHELENLRFIQRSRASGFSLDECRHLLDLARDPKRHSAEVKALVLEKVAQVESQLQELEAMRGALLSLANRCAGDEGPQCAIIDELSAEKSE